MALTSIELIRRAILRATQLGAEAATLLRREMEAELCASYALHALAEEIANDDDRRNLLQQSYSVTLTSGVGNLLTATGSITSQADILVNSVPKGRVQDNDNNVLVYLPHYVDLERPQSALFGYYTLLNERIHTRQYSTGSLTNTNTPLTVYANFIPRAQDIPNSETDRAVELLANMLMVPPPPPKK